MSNINNTIQELEILFGALCDGLLQEVRSRYLASLASEQDFYLTGERGEWGIAPFLAVHLRSTGFMVRLESYIPGVSAMVRPDWRIWLPITKKHLYLEVKMVAWGSNIQYSYQPAINDVIKLSKLTNMQTQWSGLAIFGFSKLDEPRPDWLEKQCENYLSREINKYPYKKIGLKRIELLGMDKQSSYAIVGLWVRK